MTRKNRLGHIKKRLSDNFELAMITLFGVFAMTTIFPFAIYRLSAGQYAIASADLLIVGAIAFMVFNAWVSESTRLAGVLMCVVNTLGCLAVVLMFGRHGLMWVYVVEVTNFFLTTRRTAAIASAVLIAVPLTQASLFGSELERLTFLATNLLVATCAFLFAWRTAQQRDWLQRLVRRDPLTGARNRRALNEDLPIAISVAARRHSPLALAMLDLDGFKAINDSQGHEFGDRLLQQFANAVQQTARESDQLYRYGGDEFALLMPGTPLAGASQLMERLREQVLAQLDVAQLPEQAVSVSIGVAAWRNGRNAAECLSDADAALLAAKRAGRNRVEIAM